MHQTDAPRTPLGTLLREPRSLAETGLGLAFLNDLALKTIYFGGELSGQAIANSLQLPYADIVDQILAFLIREDLVSVPGAGGFGERAYKHVATQKGCAKAQEALARSQYVGPAPVSLAVFSEAVRAQTVGDLVIKKSETPQAFSHLVISAAMLNRIGPAVNSARSIFLYGPPGNGKTRIAEAIATLLKGEVYIPYAVAVDSQVIQVYDSANHVPIALPPGHNEVPSDARWIRCQRPFIVAGGELSLEALDLIFDPISKTYQAPYQMKANGGIFLVDDFGRQLVRPRDLLNRWIVPLEKRVDFLTLQTGKKIEVPFDTLIIFATNLNPTDLADEAFLRRIHHKILVPNPTWDEYREIFLQVAQKCGVVFDDEGFKYLVLEHYIKPKREPKAVHPRDLVNQVVNIAKYHETEPRLTRELLDSAVEAYFIKF